MQDVKRVFRRVPSEVSFRAKETGVFLIDSTARPLYNTTTTVDARLSYGIPFSQQVGIFYNCDCWPLGSPSLNLIRSNVDVSIVPGTNYSSLYHKM